MFKRLAVLGVVFGLLSAVGATSWAWGESPAQEKADLLTGPQTILRELYRHNPKSKKAVEGAAGYKEKDLD